MNDRATGNLTLRLLTAAVWVPFILYLLFLAPRWLFPCVAALTCALGSFELFSMIAPSHLLLRLWGVVAGLCVFALFVLPWPPSALLLALVALTCGGMLIALARPEPVSQAATRMGWAVAGPLYVGGLFGAIAAVFAHEHGGAWVLLSLLCGFLSDTAGYFVGRSYGKRHLHPTVSPKKTIEGAMGGLAAGLASGLFAHLWLLPELPLPAALGLALAATAVGQAGDLCESLIKRSVSVKDSGTLLPGHGGILDRSDAMLFSAATVFAYLSLTT
jgi:phosphatidate cytidylyltransferase